MTTNLKLCPFCGPTEYQIFIKSGPNGDWAYCASCSCVGPIMATVQDAIKAWNTRPTPSRDGWLTREEIKKYDESLFANIHIGISIPEVQALHRKICDMALSALGDEQ